MTWKKLCKLTQKYVNERDISPFMHAGQVAAGIETKSGNVYFGICLDSKCDWGICAERAAIMDMIKNGESEVVKVVAIDRTGEVRLPCGLCREALMQLHANSKDIEILCNRDTEETIKLGELLPDWWGAGRF